MSATIPPSALSVQSTPFEPIDAIIPSPGVDTPLDSLYHDLAGALLRTGNPCWLLAVDALQCLAIEIQYRQREWGGPLSTERFLELRRPEMPETADEFEPTDFGDDIPW